MEVRALLFLALHLQSLFTIGILRHKSSKDMEATVIMVAFKAKVKKLSHAGIVYALERLLKHGDSTLIVLSVNQKMKKVNMLTHFPGLRNKCTEIGVKLLVSSIINEDLELTICREAMNQHASHVILDSSLNSKPRLTFYKHNISCNLTRIRRNGGLEFIRPKESCASLWVAPKLLSNDELIDEFEFSLGFPADSESSERSSLRIEHRSFVESDARRSSSSNDELIDEFEFSLGFPADSESSERSSLRIEHRSFVESDARRSSSSNDELIDEFEFSLGFPADSESSERSSLRIEHRSFVESDARRSSSSNDELIDEFEFSLGFPADSESSERSSLRIEHRSFVESDARRSSSLAYDSDDLFSIDIGRSRESFEYDSDDLFSIGIGSSPDRQTEIDVDSYSVTRSSLSGCWDEGDDEVVHFVRAQVPQREFFAHMIALEANRREDR